MEMSQREALCNQWACLITIDQTQAPWQPLPHFPKQRPSRHLAMHGGCDMVLRMADTGTINSGPVFISRDGCRVLAYSNFQGSRWYTDHVIY